VIQCVQRVYSCYYNLEKSNACVFRVQPRLLRYISPALHDFDRSRKQASHDNSPIYSLEMEEMINYVMKATAKTEGMTAQSIK